MEGEEGAAVPNDSSDVGLVNGRRRRRGNASLGILVCSGIALRKTRFPHALSGPQMEGDSQSSLSPKAVQKND